MRIEVEGFSAYRESVEVDFEGVDFFSLTGPTGSGKSSLVDAMIFALYGRVPRLGGNAVAPVITAGTDRARVRFFFEVDDVVYDATRLAQRTASGGASVKEARLQRDESVLAEGPGDVTKEVEELLRLGFEDFTRTVVLPQGDFARFLKATKAERQGLLRNLLGFEVYQIMREMARTRAAVATEQVDSARRSLDALDMADEEARTAALAQRDALETLAAGLPEREQHLQTLRRDVTETEKSESTLINAIDRLERISAPPKLEELETLSTDARSRVVDAREALEHAGEETSKLEEHIAKLPSSEQLSNWAKDTARLSELEVRLAADDLEGATKTVSRSQVALDKGLATLDRARRATGVARTDHAAHELAGSLVVGEPCPVCAQAVNEVPVLEESSTVADAEAAEKEAEKEVSKLRVDVESARAALVGIETMRAGLVEQRESLVDDLQHAPDDLDRLQAELAHLTTEMEKSREKIATSSAELEKAEKELEDIADASRRVGRSLTEAQLSVADLEPPVSEADDVIVQWKELVEWRSQTVERLLGEREDVAEALIQAREKAESADSELIDALAHHGVEAREPYAVQVGTALHAARAVVSSHEKAAELSIELSARIEDASGRAAVAQSLANHLKANGFEQWLMAGAVADLVGGANDLLGQLSDGGYSLHSDDAGSFSIIDHRNADEKRRVETLSGGETFLVSLALALSLAETLSAKGGSGLEAIVLDEGFGTLDDESLDIVASVLEELTGRGLMVGVITHVKELAARAPVRYEVRREPTGSKVRLLT